MSVVTADMVRLELYGAEDLRRCLHEPDNLGAWEDHLKALITTADHVLRVAKESESTDRTALKAGVLTGERAEVRRRAREESRWLYRDLKIRCEGRLLEVKSERLNQRKAAVVVQEEALANALVFFGWKDRTADELARLLVGSRHMVYRSTL